MVGRKDKIIVTTGKGCNEVATTTMWGYKMGTDRILTIFFLSELLFHTKGRALAKLSHIASLSVEL